MSYDPCELLRLREENHYLFEQVRTLSAALSERHRADFIIVKGGERFTRPPHKTAASRMLITDEVIERAALDVPAYTMRQLMAKIDALPDKGAPIDRIWRITVERDFAA